MPYMFFMIMTKITCVRLSSGKLLFFFFFFFMLHANTSEIGYVNILDLNVSWDEGWGLSHNITDISKPLYEPWNKRLATVRI